KPHNGSALVHGSRGRPGGSTRLLWIANFHTGCGYCKIRETGSRIGRILFERAAHSPARLFILGHEKQVSATTCAEQLCRRREVTHSAQYLLYRRRVGACVEPLIQFPAPGYGEAETVPVLALKGPRT